MKTISRFEKSFGLLFLLLGWANRGTRLLSEYSGYSKYSHSSNLQRYKTSQTIKNMKQNTKEQKEEAAAESNYKCKLHKQQQRERVGATARRSSALSP